MLVAVTIYTFILSDSRRPPAATALAGHHDDEKARHELATQRHHQILDDKISKTLSRGGDPSALMEKRSRLSTGQVKSNSSSEE